MTSTIDYSLKNNTKKSKRARRLHFKSQPYYSISPHLQFLFTQKVAYDKRITAPRYNSSRHLLDLLQWSSKLK